MLQDDLILRTKSQLAEEVSELRRQLAVLKNEIDRLTNAPTFTSDPRDGESLYQTIYESATVGISIADANGLLIRCNPAYQDMLGYSADELSKIKFSDITPAEDLDNNLALFEELKAGKCQRVDFEKRYIRKDGSICWVEMSTSMLRNSAGECDATLSVMHDVTDRKRAEQAKNTSEQKYKHLFETAYDSIFVIDPSDLSFIDVNENAARRLGYTRSELLRLKLSDINSTDSAALSRSSIRRTLDASENEFEITHVCKDGSLLPVEVTSGRVEIDGQVVLQSNVRDISERKQAEETLRRSEANLREAQHITSIGDWESVGATKDRRWSDEIYRILGRDRGDYESTYDSFMACVHPDDREQIVAEIRIGMASGQPYSFEYRIVRPDGTARHVLQRTVVLLAEDGELARAGTIQDITDRKVMEEQLYQAQKMEAVGQLTGGIAHDFNNLLTVMMGNMELVGDRLGDDSAESEMIERGIKAGERGAALTHRLLAFSRKQTLRPTAIDLNELVSGLTDMLRRTLGETIEIATKGAQGLWLCHVDGAQLENALLNLSINARDAMVSGGTLTIEAANISVADEADEAKDDLDLGAYVVLTVSDTGSGISQESLKHVFEPFYTTKEVGKGSGLGLSMVYGFAKQSGGAVTIDSALDFGTTVKLYLPRATELGDETSQNNLAKSAALARGERILVLEDDPDLRTLAVALLSGLGYEVLDADTAEAALEVIEQGEPIDLLLSDVILPGTMNGPDLTDIVRRQSPTTRFVYMTGYAEEAFNNNAEQDGHTPIIRKPFKTVELAAVIRSVLDQE